MPWLHVSAGALTGWVPVTAVQEEGSAADSRSAASAALAQAVAGKGMWFTNYLPHHSDVDAMIRAAQLSGLTHLYAEVAISQYGFYGRNTLDRLLPAAHAAGIKVIGWVYPTLADVASDVRLTQEVADYRTASGDQVDGIATDIEEVTTEPAVYAYGQMLRTVLGPHELLVASILHPLTHASYPYRAIATFWDVAAPMDYWHGMHGHLYSADEVRRFVTTSLTTLRAALGGATAVEETGQSYDMYTDDGAGGTDAPTPAEVSEDLAAVRQLGCIGASYFDWQTMTQSEWQVLASTAW
jgi:exo-beta-1,3-glucanase (GH17 family)